MRVLRPWISWLALVAGGCSGHDCLALEGACTAEYEPVFDAVWENTLATSCALSACHGAGSATPLDLGASADEAYAALLDGGYVVAGEPSCGTLVARIEPTGEGSMPPGGVLSEAERCAVRTWIADGALR